jgi:uncharacterized protein (TIGR03067 family)
MKRYIVMALAAGLLVAADAKKDDAKKDAEKLQGTWKVVSAEHGGQTPEGAKEFSLVVEKDTFTVKKGDDVVSKGTVKLDTSKKPKAIDMTVTESRNEGEKGKVRLGIYELTKDGLKWCFAPTGTEDRPKEFASPEGSKNIFATLKK